MEASITLTDLRDLVRQRLGANADEAALRQTCEDITTLASTPPGQELSGALPMDQWGRVPELSRVLVQHRDIIEGLRLFRLLKSGVNLSQAFVPGADDTK